jgi:hypothetical protein
MISDEGPVRQWGAPWSDPQGAAPESGVGCGTTPGCQLMCLLGGSPPSGPDLHNEAQGLTLVLAR